MHGVLRLVALALLGVLTAWLGTSQHLARQDVLGAMVPLGLLLAVALVVCTDLAVALSVPLRGRPGPTACLLAVVAGRVAALIVLVPVTPSGDLVLTGQPVTTVWLFVATLWPAFLAPVVTAVHAARTVRARDRVAT